MITTTKMPPVTRLLIVDDEAPVLAALQRALRQRFGARLQVETHTDAHEALIRLRDQPFDIVLSDLRMPQMDGLTLQTLASAIQPKSVRLLLTGSADFETAQRAINEAGLFRYLTKPWLDSELAAHLEAAISEAARIAPPAPPVPTSAQERERQRLEALEPGLTHVQWGPQGEVLMPPLG
ncbi:response regulator [Aquincola sp. S2]|uniref:Response regulator n=1 Tax=Pseudaquabacterium terrae TaxID=2732868 RepID=A0ABX2ET54_9BURK|nr:response regulator [Aquabacterium terrae]NRF71817.1 response regulator [Aquabacterium terrae]